jgi:ketosteroid isomerase-like protein
MSQLSPPKRTALSIAYCLLLAAASLTAKVTLAQRPQPEHGHKAAKQQISELEDQWKTATLTGDASLMDKLLSDDYVGISWTGQVNTKQMQLDRTRNRSVVISRLDFSDVKIKLLGRSAAIVTSLADVEGTNEGSHIDGEFRYTRVYQRLPNSQWKITNFEATRIPDPNRREHHRPPNQPAP